MSFATTSAALSNHGTAVSFQSNQPQVSVSLRPKVYFFLDFSNIAISAGQLAADHGDSLLGRSRVRLHAPNLRAFVERERVWGGGYAAVGLWNQHAAIKHRFEESGIRFDICERGQKTHKEQNVDEKIQTEMYQLLDHSVERGTVVLATGDGNGYADKRGFIQTLSILHAHHFKIEVMSWKHSLNGTLRDWAKQNGRIIELDDFYRDLTFVEGYRSAEPSQFLSNKLARLRIA
jgi:hypothetical protein